MWIGEISSIYPDCDMSLGYKEVSSSIHCQVIFFLEERAVTLGGIYESVIHS